MLVLHLPCCAIDWSVTHPPYCSPLMLIFVLVAALVAAAVAQCMILWFDWRSTDFFYFSVFEFSMHNAAGKATVTFASPWYPTNIGTNDYTDQLW